MAKQRQCKMCQRIATKDGYCAVHQQMAAQPKQDSKQRSGKAWRTWKARKFRLQFLANHPYCLDCMTIRGQPVPATVVHHSVAQEQAPERAMDPTNCAALCVDCHNSRHGRRRNTACETFERCAET